MCSLNGTKLFFLIHPKTPKLFQRIKFCSVKFLLDAKRFGPRTRTRITFWFRHVKDPKVQINPVHVWCRYRTETRTTFPVLTVLPVSLLLHVRNHGPFLQHVPSLAQISSMVPVQNFSNKPTGGSGSFPLDTSELSRGSVPPEPNSQRVLAAKDFIAFCAPPTLSHQPIIASQCAPCCEASSQSDSSSGLMNIQTARRRGEREARGRFLSNIGAREQTFTGTARALRLLWRAGAVSFLSVRLLVKLWCVQWKS